MLASPIQLLPRESWARMSAPCSMSSLTISSLPTQAAKDKGCSPRDTEGSMAGECRTGGLVSPKQLPPPVTSQLRLGWGLSSSRSRERDGSEGHGRNQPLASMFLPLYDTDRAESSIIPSSFCSCTPYHLPTFLPSPHFAIFPLTHLPTFPPSHFPFLPAHA